VANTFKTLSDGDIVRRALAIFHNKLKFIKTINRQYDSRFAVTGAKNGGSLLIRNPNQFTITTGAAMDTQDITESTQTLTVATQKNIAMNMSSVEMTMSIDDFEARYLEPAMSKLAADVEYTMLAAVYKDVWNMTGASGMASNPASLAAILNAGARLSQGLAPESDRHLLLDSIAMAGCVGAMAAYFHKASELERAFAEGYLGQAAGFKWWESNMVPRHTNGTRTDTTPVATIGGTVTVPTGGIVNGSATITMTAFPDGLTYAVGDVFTIADVYAVNPETKQAYSHLQQFTVTTAETETGSGDMSPDVTPIPQATGAKQNISIASTGAKAVVNLTAGGSGAASAVLTQNLGYHRDAFTFVSADLYKDPGARMTSAVMEGISMRLWRGNDIINDKFPTRIDVLFGYKTIRPEWAVRVRG
jgi:hypothetical protein